MLDLHSHILPNVDDGAKNLEEALEIGKIAVTEGITKMVATPHYISEMAPTDPVFLMEEIEKINHRLKQEGIFLEILPGNEIYLTLDLPERLQRKEILPINGGAYLLIELPMLEIPHYTEEILYEIRLMGYKPIIAHPERYPRIMEDPNILKDWIQQGNYAQVNSGSILGAYGKKVQKTAKILLTHGMIHCIGTDTHSPRRRPPKLQKAIEMMEDWIGREGAERLLANNEEVAAGKEIQVHQPKVYKKRNSITTYALRIHESIFKRYKYKKVYNSKI